MIKLYQASKSIKCNENNLIFGHFNYENQLCSEESEKDPLSTDSCGVIANVFSLNTSHSKDEPVTYFKNPFAESFKKQ